ncbi:isopentenyl phosphate kinase [Herpetosiphon sp. NSE202]|uniref:isopentenyl phosphate kinase n=1 Tax=Herpetosiphon sp. NSE202 TaxID=3351349 RepID=UPI003641E60E
MNKPIFIKLGGSMLTDKTSAERLADQTLKQVVTDLSAWRQAHPTQPILLGHGGGSFGHYWAERYRTAQGIIDDQSWWGVARVADAMARLNRAVVGACLDAELPAIGIQPMASGFANAGEIQTLGTQQIATLLAAGTIPVVYGDVLLDSVQGCTIASTERIFSALVGTLQPSRIILLGEQAVYDADPRQNAAAQPISLINQTNYATIIARLGGSHGVDVTGGMRNKVEAMWQLVQHAPQLEIWICGPQQLHSALSGQLNGPGTIIKLD